MTSPMVALMREFVNTPCGRIDQVSLEGSSPGRITVRRSPRKLKAVTFDDYPSSLTSSSRKRNRSQSLSPRKVLAQKDENARPATSTGHAPLKHAKLSELGHRSPHEKKQCLLEESVEDLKLELQEKEEEIQRLRKLCQFLATEVRIYTKTLEQQNHGLQKQLESHDLDLANNSNIPLEAKTVVIGDPSNAAESQ